MSPFLRKILQPRVEWGGVRRYMTYAAGEILLIVIGVFLAVQLNNWNEGRKSSDTEQTYLQRLKEEIASDTTYFNLNMAVTYAATGTIERLAAALNDGSTAEGEIIMSMKGFLEKGQYFPRFRPSRTTFDDLESTGNLGTISNAALREDITRLYRAYQRETGALDNNVRWGLTADSRFVYELDVLRWDPRSAALYPDMSSAEQVRWIRQHAPEIRRNAALHYWILNRTMEQYSASKELAADVLARLNEEMDR